MNSLLRRPTRSRDPRRPSVLLASLRREPAPRAALLPALASAMLVFVACPETALAQYCTSKSYGLNSLLHAGQKLEHPDEASFGTRIAAMNGSAVFHSAATNYDSDSPGVVDVFHAPYYSAVAYRLSVANDGSSADGDSFLADISADGEWAAFTSIATNLVVGDANGFADVFLCEISTGLIQRISMAQGGGDSNGPSIRPSVSADGRYVAYASAASNLIAGDTNDADDVFVFDRVSNSTTRASIDSSGNEGNGDSHWPVIDGKGKTVAFFSFATNLGGGSDGNGFADVFLRNRSAGITVRISSDDSGGDADGGSIEPAISLNGRYLSYTSHASDLLPGGADSNGVSDVYVENLQTMTRQRASIGDLGEQGDGPSYHSSVGNGGQVAFVSNAANFILAKDTNGVADIYVRRIAPAATFRASVDSDGAEANGPSVEPDIAADACDVLFSSAATNLVQGLPPESTGFFDVFCHRHKGSCPILCIGPEIVDITDTVKLRSTSGPPLALFALFLTHVNDAPFTQLLLLASYDANGEFFLNASIPNNPALRGSFSSFTVFTKPPGSPIEKTNSPFLGIQD